MEEPLDLEGNLPTVRGDEPPSLREDIVAELGDHLRFAMDRELGRHPDAAAARASVLKQFGSPSKVAAQLWTVAMRERIMTNRISLGLRAIAVLFAIAAVVLIGAYVARDSLLGVVYGSRGEWEFVKLRGQFTKGALQENAARDKFMELAREYPASEVEVAAYAVVAQEWPETADAEAAFLALQRATESTSIDDLAGCFDTTHLGDRGTGASWRPIAKILRERVEQEPDHARAAKLLSEAAVILWPSDRDAAPPTQLVQIADLIHDQYATSPDLANFCEVVSNLGDPSSWTRHFERHVQRILEVNQDRYVRCSAHLALATIVRSNGIERQEEAKQLYEEFLDAFDGRTSYPAQPVEQSLRRKAELALSIIGRHGLGMVAPETRGVDLDGNEISLDDYRDRVVLISFWATWCGPCLRAIPHERQLLERFGSADFAILGMNADDDAEVANAAVEEHGITWRSLHVKDTRFVNTWTIGGYPTFCLLNTDGVIVGWWRGLPPGEELNTTIHGLIKAPSIE